MTDFDRDDYDDEYSALAQTLDLLDSCRGPALELAEQLDAANLGGGDAATRALEKLNLGGGDAATRALEKLRRMFASMAPATMRSRRPVRRPPRLRARARAPRPRSTPRRSVRLAAVASAGDGPPPSEPLRPTRPRDVRLHGGAS